MFELILMITLENCVTALKKSKVKLSLLLFWSS